MGISFQALPLIATSPKRAQTSRLVPGRPRISDLVNAKLGHFSLDTLVAMLFRTGKNVELVVR